MRTSKAKSGGVGRASCKMLALAVAIAACLPRYVAAAEPEAAQETLVKFDIPAGDLSVALERFSTQSGIQVMYRQELVTGKRSGGVRGSFASSVALARVLEETGLSVERANASTYVLKPTRMPSVESGKAVRPDRVISRPDQAEDGAKELENIVVVGSRLGTYPSDSVLPVKLITREDIDRSGAGSIAQVLSLLSEVSVSNNGDTSIGLTGGGGVGLGGNGHNETNSTTVQLRGLSFGSTLILINGRRAGDSSAFLQSGQFDLSTIPLSMVDRIEVLPAGASAVYGGDGLAGVINVVLRRDAGGLEVRIRRDAAAGYGESQGSILWGRSWSRASLTAMAGWRENSSLWSTERALTADQDYTRFGGRDLRAAGFGGLATVYSLAGCDLALGFCVLPLDQRGNLPGLNAPVATVPVGSSGVGLSAMDFLATEGKQSLASNEFPMVTAERATSAAINGSLEITNNIEIIGELTYTKRRLPEARQLPFQIAAGQFGLSSSVVTADNPFNPFGVDVGVSYTFRETEIYKNFSQEYWRLLVGAQGKFWKNKWDWEVTAWRSEDKSSTGSVTVFDSRLFARALGSSDPSEALNPFVGDGSAPVSREILASLLAPPIGNDYLSRTDGINGFVRGRVLELPAGHVVALAGAERQGFAYESNVDVSGQAIGSIGGDSSKALFTEARVPILSGDGKDGLEKLALTGAFRHESTSRFSSAAKTKTIGVEYRPNDFAFIRATYSTAFKPPTVYSVNRDVSLSSINLVTDPLFGGAFLVPVISGGGVSADLNPERSTSRTLGVVLSPAFGWRISITGWDVQVNDRLTAAGPQFFIDHEDEFPGRVVRNPETGMIDTIDVRQFNIAATSTSGADITLEGVVASKFGDFLPSIAATYVAEHKERTTDLSPEINNLGVIRNSGWSPRWKVVPRVAWSYKDAYATLAARYVSSYDDPLPLLDEFGNQAQQRLGSFWMLDFNLELSIAKWMGIKSDYLSGTRLGIGATNVLDRLPSFCNYCISGYDPNQYQIMGRKVYAELKFDF